MSQNCLFVLSNSETSEFQGLQLINVLYDIFVCLQMVKLEISDLFQGT